MLLTPELKHRTDGGNEKKRLEGRCRMCLRPSTVRRLTAHHLVGRAWFKTRLQSITDEEEWFEFRLLRDADANLVPLCDPSFCIKMRGREWFDQRYPPVRAARARVTRSAGSDRPSLR